MYKKFFNIIGIISVLAILVGCKNYQQPDQITNSTPDTQVVKIFLVDLYSPEKEFSDDFVKETGCGDHLIAKEKKIPIGINPILGALEALFKEKTSPNSDNTDQLFNALNASDLKVQSIHMDESYIEVFFHGAYQMAGDCSGARFVDQIKETVIQNSDATHANIFINGRILETFDDPRGAYDITRDLSSMNVNWNLYKNNIYNFKFEFPRKWRHSIPKNASSTFSASDIYPAGGIGDEIPLGLDIKISDKNNYVKEQFQDYSIPPKVIEPKKSEKISFFEVEKYILDGPEGSKNIVHLAETSRGSSVITFKFKYTLKGCEYIFADDPKPCLEKMQIFEANNIKTINNIFQSFEFVK